MTSPLIDAQTLADRLKRPGWIAIDCRFRLGQPAAGPALYGEGHIPGARYAHLDHDLAATPKPEEGRHPLPAPEEFAATLGRLGISNATTVVAYDDASGAIAARLWWLLRWAGHDRVRVLNGGLQAWQAAGLPLETRTPTWEPAQFAIREVHHSWVVSTAELAKEVERGAALLDARSAERFRGDAEPIDPVAGHVPGARNYPFSSALDETGLMRDPAALQDDLRQFVEHPGGVIAMCGSGVTACHLLLSLNAAGLGDGRAYIGSWSEWIRDPDRPIALGSDAGIPAA